MRLSEICNNRETLIVRWAVGDNIKHASEVSRFDQTKKIEDENENIVVWVSIKPLFDKTNVDFKLDLNTPSGGDKAISKRIDNCISHWKNGGWMDPPFINVHNDEIQFIDGRHRMFAAYRQGAKTAPVIIPTDEIPKLRSVIGGGSISSKEHLNEHP